MEAEPAIPEAATPSVEEVRELFHGRQLRCTRQREVVYAALAASATHPTAEELHHLVLRHEPGLSLATIYNTLEVLIDCGLARRLAAGGCCRFDAVTTPHVHLATRDGKVFDVPADISQRLLDGLSPEVLAELEARMGVRIAHLNVQVVSERNASADARRWRD